MIEEKLFKGQRFDGERKSILQRNEVCGQERTWRQLRKPPLGAAKTSAEFESDNIVEWSASLEDILLNLLHTVNSTSPFYLLTIQTHHPLSFSPNQCSAVRPCCHISGNWNAGVCDLPRLIVAFVSDMARTAEPKHLPRAKVADLKARIQIQQMFARSLFGCDNNRDNVHN